MPHQLWWKAFFLLGDVLGCVRRNSGICQARQWRLNPPFGYSVIDSWSIETAALPTVQGSSACVLCFVGYMQSIRIECQY